MFTELKVQFETPSVSFGSELLSQVTRLHFLHRKFIEHSGQATYYRYLNRRRDANSIQVCIPLDVCSRDKYNFFFLV